MYEIPRQIQIGNQIHNIRNEGDFRMVLDCFSALDDEALSNKERLMACLIIFYEDMNGVEDLGKLEPLDEAVKKMYDFFNCGDDVNGIRAKSYKLVDWDKDAQLISSAVNKVAGKEVRSEKYLHWWTFMGYYMGIGECPFSTILGIRQKIVDGTKMEKHERKFRMENPQYFNWDFRTVSDKETDAIIQEMWEGGK